MTSNTENFPLWFRELAEGPQLKATTFPMYCTRGFTFHTAKHGTGKSTANYGISIKGDTSDFYGILTEIVEVAYPGLVNMKCIIFRCDWYDPILNRGIRKNKYGVIDINSARRYNKYDPFVLASQADQVCYIPYPHLKKKTHPWLAVIKINPRGRVEGVSEQDLTMQGSVQDISPIDPTMEELMLVDVENQDFENLWTDSNGDETESEELSSESE